MPPRPDAPTLALAAAFAVGSLANPCREPQGLELFLVPLLALLAWRRRRQACALVLCAAALGCAAHLLQDARSGREERLRRALRQELERDGSCDLEGTLSEIWDLPTGARRAHVLLRRLACGGAGRPVRGGALLTLPARRGAGAQGPEPLPGDLLLAHARLSQTRRAGNPGAFDSAQLLAARGTLLVGSVKSAALAQVRPRSPLLPGALLARCRVWLARRLEAAVQRLPRPDPASATLLSALLLGQRADLEPALRRSLQATGLYHLVAISGMHVALLGWLFMRLCRALGLPQGASAAFTGTLLASYVLLVGAPASAARALAMLWLWQLGRRLGRRATGVAVAASSCTLLLAAFPSLSRDAGFWLSTCATAAIVGPLTRPAAERSGAGLASSAARSLRASAAAYLAVSPLEALWFQRWTPLGIALNLVAVPLSTLLLVGALLLAACGGSALSAPVALLADSGVRALRLLSLPSLGQAEMFRLPGPAPPLLAAHLAAAAALAADLPGARSWRALLAAAHLALALPASPPASSALEFTLWDVGQGESGMLRLADGSSLLVDTGGRLLAGDTAMERWVLPALRASGVRRLEVLALSHLDSDHAAGAREAIEALRPREVWAPVGLPEPESERLRGWARRQGSALSLLRSRDRRVLAGATVEVLAPAGAGPRAASDNAGSLVLRVEWRGASILLTGDLEGEGERELAASGMTPATVLKVSHHGSRGSTQAPLLRATRPRAALVSAGARNPWGHPHREALDRLRRIGAVTLSTSQGGAVRATIRAGTVRLERWQARWLEVARAPASANVPHQPEGHGRERQYENGDCQ